MKVDPESLLSALRLLPPRSTQVLMFRFADRRPEAELAGLYGISVRALRVHLARALGLLEEALRASAQAGDEGRVRPLLPEAGLQAASTAAEDALAEALFSSPPERSALATRLGALAEALAACGPRLRELEARHALAEAQSPSARRHDLLRRLALVGLISLAVWLYLRSGR
jgi:hypothetical protein